MRRRALALLLATSLVATVVAAAHGSSTPRQTLVGRTGPGFDITLRTQAGAKVTRLTAGTYLFRIVDRTGDDAHNFRLVGPGVQRATSVGFVGTRTWQVTLQHGKTYRFLCDPHAFVMKGSFRVT